MFFSGNTYHDRCSNPRLPFELLFLQIKSTNTQRESNRKREKLMYGKRKKIGEKFGGILFLRVEKISSLI
jgi:hypothetical protein